MYGYWPQHLHKRVRGGEAAAAGTDWRWKKSWETVDNPHPAATPPPFPNGLLLLLPLLSCCLATQHHSSPACDWSAACFYPQYLAGKTNKKTGLHASQHTLMDGLYKKGRRWDVCTAIVGASNSTVECTFNPCCRQHCCRAGLSCAYAMSHKRISLTSDSFLLSLSGPCLSQRQASQCAGLAQQRPLELARCNDLPLMEWVVLQGDTAARLKPPGVCWRQIVSDLFVCTLIPNFQWEEKSVSLYVCLPTDHVCSERNQCHRLFWSRKHVINKFTDVRQKWFNPPLPSSPLMLEDVCDKQDEGNCKATGAFCWQKYIHSAVIFLHPLFDVFSSLSSL